MAFFREDPLVGEVSLDEAEDGLSGGDGSLDVDDLDLRTPRPASSTYGVICDLRRPARLL